VDTILYLSIYYLVNDLVHLPNEIRPRISGLILLVIIKTSPYYLPKTPVNTTMDRLINGRAGYKM